MSPDHAAPKRSSLAMPLAMSCVLAASAASAQDTPPPPAQPPAIAACTAIENAASRLACYDEAVGRAVVSTEEADMAAEQARQALAATRSAEAEAAELTRRERARRAVGELFTHDGEHADALGNAGRGSLLDSRWELAKDSKLGTFNVRAYKPVYLLPAFWTSDVNSSPRSPNPRNTATEPMDVDALEAKFQLGFKTKAAENLFGDNGDVWLGYTQSSRWQVYSKDNSRPFRETNYEPEAMLVFRNGYSLLGWRGRMAAVGVNHQSNGRSDPYSRSWNRVIFNIGLDRDNWALMIRPWVRISDGNDDDNPDIDDYMGRGDVTLTHVRNGHELTLMARHSLRGGDRANGALQFDWGFPLQRHFRGHLQVFSGYGESMIDYNHRATYVGLGVSLLEWF